MPATMKRTHHNRHPRGLSAGQAFTAGIRQECCKAVHINGMTAIFMLMLLFLPMTAHAACSVEGEMAYNSSEKVMQYCDGTNWIGVGVNVAGGNITVTTTPTVIDTVTADAPDLMLKEGDYIYVADNWNSSGSGGINVFDASDPTSLTQIGTLDHAQLRGAYGVAKSGNYLFVTFDNATGDDGITAIDVSDPSLPSYVSSMTHADLNDPYDIKIKGNYAYVTANGAGALTVINISNPAAMTYEASDTRAVLNSARRLEIVDNTVFVASRSGDSLVAYDISTPTSLVYLDHYTVSGADFIGLKIKDGTAYLSAQSLDAIYRIDVSNPSSMSLLGSTTGNGLDAPADLYIYGNYLFVSSGGAKDELMIYDISGTPSFHGETTTGGNIANGADLLVDGAYAYVIGDYALSSVNIAEPCTLPSGEEGEMIYNTSEKVMQFCNGSEWIAMGPVPGAGTGGCSNPSGAEGDMVYNTTHNVMQYCDGDDWVGISGSM